LSICIQTTGQQLLSVSQRFAWALQFFSPSETWVARCRLLLRSRSCRVLPLNWRLRGCAANRHECAFGGHERVYMLQAGLGICSRLRFESCDVAERLTRRDSGGEADLESGRVQWLAMGPGGGSWTGRGRRPLGRSTRVRRWNFAGESGERSGWSLDQPVRDAGGEGRFSRFVENPVPSSSYKSRRLFK
jgi:hypothetical protein